MPYFSDYCHRPSCVYRLYDTTGVLLYVGMSTDPSARITSHQRKPWGHLIASHTIKWFDDRWSAKDAERFAIRDENPVHNIVRPRNLEGVTN